MKSSAIISACASAVLAAGALAASEAAAQQFKTYDQCMNALWSRCASLMDQNAKRSCVKGNVVYCTRFPSVIVREEDIPFSDRFPQYRDLEAVKPRDLRQDYN